jgi:hypothetical protein
MKKKLGPLVLGEKKKKMKPLPKQEKNGFVSYFKVDSKKKK